MVEGSGPRLTRRQLLKASAGLAAGAGAAYSGYMEMFERANAQVPNYGTLSDIEHIIFVVQENRSFDHYFGNYKGVRGFGDPTAFVRPDGTSVFAQPDSTATAAAGYNPPNVRLPFHISADTLTGDACVSDPDHGWVTNHRMVFHPSGTPSRIDLNPDGTPKVYMDGAMQAQIDAGNAARGPIVMGYYTKDDLPFYHALANSYTICDRYFASLIGQSDPNRIMCLAASIDPEGRTGGPVINTAGTNRTALYGRLTHRTMAENLQDAGVSWRSYNANDANPLTNLYSAFKNFHFTPDPLYLTTELSRNAFFYSYPMGFAADVAAVTATTDNFPKVSWVLTSVADSEHPPAPPSFGEYDVSQVVNTVLQNPYLYAKTAIFITWDDPGGFFDHVVPPVSPPSTLGEFITDDAQTRAFPSPSDLGPYYGPNVPIGLGFRVPMLVVSPFSRGGRVCSDTFDHTSMLRLLETRFGVSVPNLTAWRRSVTGDLTTAFNFGTARDLTGPGITAPGAPSPVLIAQVQSCIATAGGTRPYTAYPTTQMNGVQEAGTRPQPTGPVIAEITSITPDASLPEGGGTIIIRGAFLPAGEPRFLRQYARVERDGERGRHAHHRHDSPRHDLHERRRARLEPGHRHEYVPRYDAPERLPLRPDLPRTPRAAHDRPYKHHTAASCRAQSPRCPRLSVRQRRHPLPLPARRP